MNDIPNAIKELLKEEDEQRFLDKIQNDPSLKNFWESFVAKERKTQEKFFHNHQLFTDEELKNFLIGKADAKLCQQIESDSGYQKWIHELNQEPSWSDEDKNQIERVLAKVHAFDEIDWIFTWNEKEEEIIKEVKTDKILLKMANTEISQKELEPELARSSTPQKKEEICSYWEVSLPNGKGLLAIELATDGYFTVILKELTGEFAQAKMILTGKTNKKKDENPVLRGKCVFSHLSGGEYTILAQKKETNFSLGKFFLPEGKRHELSGKN